MQRREYTELGTCFRLSRGLRSTVRSGYGSQSQANRSLLLEPDFFGSHHVSVCQAVRRY